MKRNYFMKSISFLLLFAMIFSCVALCISCAKDNAKTTDGDVNNAGNEGSDNDALQEEINEDEFDPKLPDMDFGGTEFRILNVNQETMWWSIVDLDIAIDEIEHVGTALNDAVVNDAIYTRNRNIEAKYNFIINEKKVAGGTLNTMVRNCINSGSDDYDLIAPQTQSAPGMATSNYLVDLNKIPFLNFENPWWNSSVSQWFSMNGRLFFTCSDFTLSDKDNVAILMYNKKLAENLGIESGDALYKLVGDGKWTFDKFQELCKTAIADLNGDGVIKGSEDRYGLSCCGWYYTQMVVGFGETIIKKDDNDLPYIAAKTERFSKAYTTMVEFMMQRDTVVREFEDTPNMRTEEMFVNDKALFCTQVLACVRLYKNMGSDFALLPSPKLDESQDKYYTPNLWSSCLAIPTTNPDLEKTGFILEALSAESKKIVIPAYYEISIGTKYLRDDTSVKMLDIILQNGIYDINEYMYNWGNFSSPYTTAARKGDVNFTSLLEKSEARIEAAMQKTIDAYAEID